MKLIVRNWKIPSVTRVIDCIIAFLLVIAPAFQQYKGPFVNAGWTLWLVGFILVLVQFVLKRITTVSFPPVKLAALFFLVAYYFYHLFAHGFNAGNLLTTTIVLVLYLYISSMQFDYKTFLRVISCVVLVNAVCLAVQYICYYIIHYNLQLVDLSKLVEQDYRWVRRLSTTATNLAFYRPSGLFLEPSHVYLFSFPLVIYYFTNSNSTKKEKMIAWIALISVMISTSSMGVVFVIGMLVAYLVMFKNPKYKTGSLLNFFTPKTVLILTGTVLVFWILYIRIDVFQQMVLRILATDADGYNAISGRTQKGIGLLGEMTAVQKIFGISDTMGELGKSISGYQGEMYKYGSIGVVLSYIYYSIFLLCSKEHYAKYLALILIAISFVCAHTHRDFYMLYFGVFLFYGFTNDGKRTSVAT